MKFLTVFRKSLCNCMTVIIANGITSKINYNLMIENVTEYQKCQVPMVTRIKFSIEIMNCSIIKD